MKTSHFRPALVALSSALAMWSGNASAALVTLSSAFVEVGVPGDRQGNSVVAIPASEDMLAFSSFGQSRVQMAYSSPGNATSLAYTGNYSRNVGSPSTSALANYSTAVLWFSVDRAATYQLAGRLVVNDPVSGAGPTYGTSLLSAYLMDVTDALPTTLLNSVQSSTSIEDAFLRLGDPGLTGSLTGTLQAGRTYKFQYLSQIGTPLNTVYGGMTADSSVRLDITATEPPPVTPVPEPGTLALLLAAVLGYSATRRR